MSRLKRQLSKHCSRIREHPVDETREEKTAETRIRRTKLGTNQVGGARGTRAAAEGDHTAEAYRDALWTYILGLVRAGVEELQNRPSAPETDGSQTYDYVQISFRCTMTITQSERFTTSLPRDHALAIHYQPPERPKRILMRFGPTSSAWSKQASRNFKTDPAYPEPMDHRQLTMCRFLGHYDELSRRNESIHYQPPEGPRACHPNRN